MRRQTSRLAHAASPRYITSPVHAANPAPTASLTTIYASELGKCVDMIRECGEQGTTGLARLPKELLKDFTACIDRLDALQGADVAVAMGSKLWCKLVQLKGIALRQLIELTSSGNSSRVKRVEILLGGILFLFIKTNALKTGSAMGARLALALLKTDTFQCYACLLTAWTGCPPDSLEPKLRLIAQFSLIFSSIAQLTVSDQPLTPNDCTGTALYEACLHALSSSHLLERISKALLTGLGSYDEQLPLDHARNIRIGVMETCGCVVSALHGIAGKQGILDSSWQEGQGQLPGHEAAKRLLPLVRAVLSGPCLQFLLGREIIASRLRITGGKGCEGSEGPRYGLPDPMLPELMDLDRRSPTDRPMTDRLLSRLGAAGLVWHLVISEVPGEAAPPAQQPAQQAGPGGPQQQVGPAEPAPPIIRYRLENLFDMVLEALLCVVDPSVKVEHLPGGSQLTLVEPAMLLVRLALRLRPRSRRERLGRLWEVLVKLLTRPLVRLQYSEHRPLQLIGGLLRLELQLGAQQGAGAAAAEALDDAGCSFNLRCALDAGFLRAVEQLLRGWGRADPVITRGETSCLCAVNHLLRWTCLWPAVLAHGSVREVASLTVTLRRLGEVFKQRGFQDGTNEPNEHQDAEVVVTAYMVALLEQLAVVLLPASGDSRPLALNEALESGGQASFDGVVDQLGGRPASGTAQAAQQRTLAVFALSQWLPNAVWLARVVDTWFSVDMGKAVLRWVLEAALQCLVARDRSEAERALEARFAAQPAVQPETEPQLEPQSQPEAHIQEQLDWEKAAQHDVALQESWLWLHEQGLIQSPIEYLQSEWEGKPPLGETEPVAAVKAVVAAMPEAQTQAQRDETSPAKEAQLEDEIFLTIKDSYLPDIMLDNLDDSEDEEAELELQATELAALPGALALAPLETVARVRPDVQTQAATSSGNTGRSSTAGPGAVAYVAWVTFLMVGVDALAWMHKYLVQLKELQDGRDAAGMREEADSGSEGAGVKSGDVDGELAAGGGTEGTAGLDPEALLPRVLDVLEVLSLAVPRSVQMCVRKDDTAGAPAGAERPTATATMEPPQPSPTTSAERPGLRRDIVLDGWLRSLLEREGRRELLAVLEVWAEQSSCGGDGEGSVGASEASAPSISPEQQTLQLATLRAALAAKHDLAALPELPSPYAAAEAVEAAGIQLCANPDCSNLEGDSEAELSGRKICSRCKSVSYCSDLCKQQHGDSQHEAECPAASGEARSASSQQPSHEQVVPGGPGWRPPDKLQPGAPLQGCVQGPPPMQRLRRQGWSWVSTEPKRALSLTCLSNWRH